MNSPVGREADEGAAVPDLDTSRPHPARIYDYYLGGKNHFAADRETADKVLQVWPHIRVAAREQRKFLGRAVGYLAREAGIRCTGLPDCPGGAAARPMIVEIPHLICCGISTKRKSLRHHPERCVGHRVPARARPPRSPRTTRHAPRTTQVNGIGSQAVNFRDRIIVRPALI
jgi:hypothetical protein